MCVVLLHRSATRSSSAKKPGVRHGGGLVLRVAAPQDPTARHADCAADWRTPISRDFTPQHPDGPRWSSRRILTGQVHSHAAPEQSFNGLGLPTLRAQYTAAARLPAYKCTSIMSSGRASPTRCVRALTNSANLDQSLEHLCPSREGCGTLSTHDHVPGQGEELRRAMPAPAQRLSSPDLPSAQTCPPPTFPVPQ